MTTDASPPPLRVVLKTCSSCGATVPREQIHRNRYREYICRECRARGVRFTWRRRARHEWQKFRKAKGRTVAWILAVCAAVVLTLLWIAQVMD